jgi:hypothetical protein
MIAGTAERWGDAEIDATAVGRRGSHDFLQSLGFKAPTSDALCGSASSTFRVPLALSRKAVTL